MECQESRRDLASAISYCGESAMISRWNSTAESHGIAYLGQEPVDVLIVVQQIGDPGIVAGTPVGELPKGSCYRIHFAADG